MARPWAGPGGPGPGGVLSPSSDDSFLPKASQEEEGLTSGENWFIMRIWSWGCALFDAESQGCELQVAEVPSCSCAQTLSTPCSPCAGAGGTGVRPGGMGSTCELVVSIKQKTRVPSERLALLTGWAALGAGGTLRGHTGVGACLGPFWGAKRGNSPAHTTDLTQALMLSPPAVMTHAPVTSHIYTCHGDKKSRWSLAHQPVHRWLWRLLTRKCVWRTNPVHSHLCPQV